MFVCEMCLTDKERSDIILKSYSRGVCEDCGNAANCIDVNIHQFSTKLANEPATMPESTYSPDFTRALAMTRGMPTHWTQERKIGVAVNEVNRQLTIEWCSYLDMPVLWEEANFIVDECEPKDFFLTAELKDMRKQSDSIATRIDQLASDKVAYINSICPPVMYHWYEDDQDEADRQEAITLMRNGQ